MISLVENDSPQAQAILNEVYVHVGRAHRIGVTGPPGAGKSTLVEKMTALFRKEGKTVAIVAVDPTSPFTGGAILGDRVRMSSLFCDPGVFIRSMATRGSSGGLAFKTQEVCDLLDAFGKDVIILETIGVGQAELDVAGTAQTTVIVLVPESGDGIQAMKAGLMEIGDLFVVNKSDRDGADRLMLEIQMMLDLRPQDKEWKPKVMQTTASAGEGVDTLVRQICGHWEYLKNDGILGRLRRENIRSAIADLVRQRLERSFWEKAEIQSVLNRLAGEVVEGKMSPYQAFERLLEVRERMK